MNTDAKNTVRDIRHPVEKRLSKKGIPSSTPIIEIVPKLLDIIDSLEAARNEDIYYKYYKDVPIWLQPNTQQARLITSFADIVKIDSETLMRIDPESIITYGTIQARLKEWTLIRQKHIERLQKIAEESNGQKEN